MAKIKDYDKIHYNNIEIYARQIETIYKSALKEGADISALISNFNSSTMFSFTNYPITKTRVDKLIKTLSTSIETVVLNGIDVEWTLSNNKNSELSRRVFGDNIGKLTKYQERRYFSNNMNALDAFKKRKISGIGLSDMVWRYADQFKSEIELAIDCGLRDRLSANEMARELRQYLQEPNKLFRRVRDEHGNLGLSKAAKVFNPRQGVYRSSVRNAQRLARTEINISYRNADHERWQQMDFVVGYEVKRSTNHSFYCPMCDGMAGKYPKDFKFSGWHPSCRCFVIPILMTDDEFWSWDGRGEAPKGSVNEVKDMPKGFKHWEANNLDKISKLEKRGALPYFLRDNKGFRST